jgi:hypothetical protein
MFDPQNPILWLIGAVALVATLWLLRSHFGAEARERRRRARSHGRVVSKGRRPTVVLSAKTPKSRNE